MSDHAAVRDLLPLFVLGALDGSADCEAVCAHLATGCPACAEELAAFARTSAKLPEALAPVAPRPAAREKLAAALAKTPQAAPSNVVALRRGPSPMRGWTTAAIAASVAALAMVAAVRSSDELRREKEWHFTAEKRLADADLHAKDLEERLAQDRESMLALANGTAKVFALAPQPGETGSARVVWDTSARKWVLFASGLKPAAAGKEAYELWFIQQDKKGNLTKISAGKFTADANGFVRYETSLPANLASVELGAITREPIPDPDAVNPSGPIVLLGKTT